VNFFFAVVAFSGCFYTVKFTEALVAQQKPSGAIVHALSHRLRAKSVVDTVAPQIAVVLAHFVAVSLLGLLLLPSCLPEPHIAAVQAYAVSAGGLLLTLGAFFDTAKLFGVCFGACLAVCFFYMDEDRSKVFITSEALGIMFYVNALAVSVHPRLNGMPFSVPKWLALTVPCSCLVTLLQHKSLDLCKKHYTCLM
jgi:hypothetical protein